MLTLSAEGRRLDDIARALDNLPSTLPARYRAEIFEAIYRPTRDNWRRARLHHAVAPTPARPRPLTLWALLMAVHNPPPERCADTPTGAQIIHALNHARDY